VQDWVAALELADRCWRAAEAVDVASVTTDAAGDLQKLRVWGGQLAAEAWPSPAPVAQLWAGSWLNAVRAFAHPECAPETRTACAAVLREATRSLDQLLTLHRTAQARGTWARQFGDGGD
jgi:hypothetical protein